MLKKKSGFSLIELVVVIGIIGMLTTIGMVAFGRSNVSGRNAKRKSDLTQLQSAITQYRIDAADGRYPAAIDFRTMSPIQNYINVSSMLDPRTQEPYVYTYTSATNTFSVCATLEETTPDQYCVRNP